LNTKVLQGSVSTQVRCDEIFNDYSITAESKGEKKENRLTFAEVIGNYAGGRFFKMKHGV